MTAARFGSLVLAATLAAMSSGATGDAWRIDLDEASLTQLGNRHPEAAHVVRSVLDAHNVDRQMIHTIVFARQHIGSFDIERDGPRAWENAVRYEPEPSPPSPPEEAARLRDASVFLDIAWYRDGQDKVVIHAIPRQADVANRLGKLVTLVFRRGASATFVWSAAESEFLR